MDSYCNNRLLESLTAGRLTDKNFVDTHAILHS